MRCSDKDRFSTDSIHVDAGTSLKVIEVDVTILRNQEYYIMLFTDLYKENKHFSKISESEVKSLGCVRLFVTPWTVAHQAPLSMRFSRQEYWSGLPFPSPQ